MRELRPPVPRRAFQLVEVLAGEQSQIDWGHLGRFTIDGVLRDVNFFVLVFSWSRAFWAELVLELSTASLLRSLVRAANYFGGTTRQWIFDNTKSVVLDRSGANIRFNPELLDFAAQFHVLPKVCTPRRANEKGRVERTIRYLRERHFAGRSGSPARARGEDSSSSWFALVFGAAFQPRLDFAGCHRRKCCSGSRFALVFGAASAAS